MMKLIVLSFLFIVAINGQEHFKAGQRVIARRSSARAVKSVVLVCNTADKANKRYCNGATTKEVCDATGFYQCKSTIQTGSEVLCGGDLPYCTQDEVGEAKCSAEPDQSCTAEVREFFCTGEGVFPDPLDCKKYYFCSANTAGDLIADVYMCDDLYVFDPSGPKNEYCRLTMNRYCTTAACAGTFKNLLLTYNWFPKALGQIVASCQGTRPAIIYRCEKGFEANLQTLPVECNLICTRADKFAYAGDETKYYECVYTGSKWQSKIKSCFPTYIFNAKTKTCEVKLTSAPSPESEPLD